MKNLIFVKLGGGLITDKTTPYTPKLDVIGRLAQEIIEARKEKNFNLLLGHGGGSFPHTSAKKYKTHEGFLNQESKYGFCKVRSDAAELNQIVIKFLIEAGEKVFSIPPSSCFLSSNSEISDSYLKTTKKLLDYNIVPVFYGDAVVDLKKGCCILSTEKILLYLAKKLKPKEVIIADKVDGVFTDDPLKNKEAQFIPKINRKNWNKIKKYLKGSDGIDVTGGMLHKVEKSLELAKTGSKVLIINGNKPDYLKRALLGELLGTQIEW
ncbi:MAG: isopentenyl phosphate kinase [Candidatus Nealsonbacteria bacterium]|nr:isopentenyl phosphate kinase [Candidatus Nealsonbacteria bacterium]